jgi:hypothetical protein
MFFDHNPLVLVTAKIVALTATVVVTRVRF